MPRKRVCPTCGRSDCGGECRDVVMQWFLEQEQEQELEREIAQQERRGLAPGRGIEEEMD